MVQMAYFVFIKTTILEGNLILFSKSAEPLERISLHEDNCSVVKMLVGFIVHHIASVMSQTWQGLCILGADMHMVWLP